MSRLDLYDSVGRTAADITTAEPPSGQVLVDLPNGLDFFVVVLASWAAGRSPVVVPHGSSAAELDRLLGSGALADTGFIAAHGVVAGEAGAGDGWRRFPPHHIDEPDPSWFLPSGGSTGLPTLTPANGRPADLLAGQQLLLAALGWTHDATQLVMGPLNHAAPFTSSVAGLLAGNHLVVLERFNPAAVLDAAVRHQPTWFQATPHQMAILATKSSVVDALSVHLTGMMHTAAPCPQAVKESWIRLLGGERVFELYGSTQMVGVVICDGVQWEQHRGSVGRPFMTQIRILDQAGRPLPPGQVGEVFMRTSATRNIRGDMSRHLRSAPGGFLSVGDLGYVDRDGFLYLTDRVDDMIIVGGANVSVREVESVLLTHPAVSEALVVGRPHSLMGAVPHAIVSLADGSEASPRALVEHCRAHLAPHKVPMTVEVVLEFERSSAGKVKRFSYR